MNAPVNMVAYIILSHVKVKRVREVVNTRLIVTLSFYLSVLVERTEFLTDIFAQRAKCGLEVLR